MPAPDKSLVWLRGEQLSEEERAFIETKLALAEDVRRRRKRQKLTQVELARRLGSSQSRVAKLEAGDASVSMDLIVRSLFRMGARRGEVARIIRRAKAKRRARTGSVA